MNIDTSVEFEVAKLAKEHGFDWRTRWYYQHALTERIHPEDGAAGPFGWKLGETSLQIGHFINFCKLSDLTNESWFQCSAPYRHEIENWLRVECGIHLMHRPFFDSIDGDKYVCDVIRRCDGRVIKSSRYGDYVDAFDEGLLNSFKLIALK